MVITNWFSLCVNFWLHFLTIQMSVLHISTASSLGSSFSLFCTLLSNPHMLQPLLYIDMHISVSIDGVCSPCSWCLVTLFCLYVLGCVMLECCMWQEGEVGSEMVAVPSRDSDNSSGHSTPEVRHRGAVSSHPQGAGGGLDPTRPHSQALDNPLYANLEHVSNVCMCWVAFHLVLCYGHSPWFDLWYMCHKRMVIVHRCSR